MNKIQQVKIQQVLNVTLLSNKKITTFYLKNSSEVNFNTKNFKLSGRFNHTLKEKKDCIIKENYFLNFLFLRLFIKKMQWSKFFY